MIGEGQVIELGAGTDPDPRSDVLVDIAALDGIDYVRDIEDTPWTEFASGEFDHVIATHVFEHVSDPGAVFEECCRVLRDGGRIEITVPLGLSALTDPTHESIWTWETPEFFGSEGERDYYYDLPLTLVDRSVDVRLRGPARVVNCAFKPVVGMLDSAGGDLAWLSVTPFCSGELTAVYQVNK